MRICKQSAGSGIGQKRPTTEVLSDVEPKKPASSINQGFNIVKLRQAFNGAAETWRISFPDSDDVITQLKDGILVMERKLSTFRYARIALKFTMALHAVFEQSSNPSVITEPPACLVSEPFEVYADTNIKEQLINAYKQLLNEIDVYERNGSGWVLSYLTSLDTSLWELDPLRASSYHRLPQWIINKRAARNIRNDDQECFKWAVIAGLDEPTMPTKPCDVASYQAYEVLYDWSMLKFPVPLTDIKKFGKANNISINVYGCTDYNQELECSSDEDDDLEDVAATESLVNEEVKPNKKKRNSIHPLKVTHHVQERHINLLLTEKDGNQHYSTITNFNRLAGSQISSHGHRKFFCYSCLHGFSRPDLLRDHKNLCEGTEAQREVFPYKDPILKFTNIKRQLKTPFVCYADAESILKSVESPMNTGISRREERKEG